MSGKEKTSEENSERDAKKTSVKTTKIASEKSAKKTSKRLGLLNFDPSQALSTSAPPPLTSHLAKGNFPTRPSVISLFAGIGGVCSGFINAGFDIAFANEIDTRACVTYRANFKHPLIEADITKLDPKDFPKADIVAGGFPCQAFSIAGYQKGFADTRGTLFFDIMRFVDYSKPKVIFLENVKNIIGHDSGRTLKTILEEIEDLGYHARWRVLNTATHANLPQNRERFFLVAFSDINAYKSFSFPLKMRLETKISDLIEPHADAKYFYNSHPLFETLKQQITRTDTLYQWRRQYVRENKSRLCPTLTANMGTGGHNVPLVKVKDGIRKLTPRECANFQGLSKDFILPNELTNSTLYKQIGNSVSVPLIEAIAKQIYKALNEKSENSKDKLVLS